jgi:hypothetical protein
MLPKRFFRPWLGIFGHPARPCFIVSDERLTTSGPFVVVNDDDFVVRRSLVVNKELP